MGGPARSGLALVARALVAGLVLAVATTGGPTRDATARVLVDRERALAQAFGPRAEITTRTVFLTAEAARRAEQAAAAKLASLRVTLYEATRGDTLLGTGYLDTHRVRTMNETVLVVVTPKGKVGAVEVLAFHEPDDYLPPRRWLERFEDQALAKDLRPGGSVPSLGGSTLTARAIAAAVRRTLALHAAVAAQEAAAGRAKAKAKARPKPAGGR